MFQLDLNEEIVAFSSRLLAQNIMLQTMVYFLSLLNVLVAASNFTDESSANQYLNNTRRIPEIKEGEKCIKGLVYKMDCNTCHCGANSRLLCTKMACLDNFRDLKKKEKRTKGKLRSDGQSCVPGKLYKKGCQKCFCTDNKTVKCSKSDCKLATGTYINPEHVQSLTPAEFYKLPSLPHRGMECRPGVTYRIDCNTCFCLDVGNLMCQKLLCPSYEDLYRLNAKEISGKPCDAKASIVQDCIDCKCVAGKFACETKPECQHSDGRRMMHGEFPSDGDRNFIDLEKMNEKCAAGMVYKVHCNKCYCQEDGSLRCTQKSCLNFSEVQRLKKLKAKLDQEDPEGNN